ncbi:hypothetical protein [Haloglomus litoreum]|uniref:hypothetical protein n=1 Tax=Haloglomus litoreum TaxID=3034026 RepID=UPI0023E7CEC5|nr:hypothetical protein [Haloglomus sp. DT116]
MADPSHDGRGATAVTDEGERRVRLVPVTGDWPAQVREALAATDWTDTPVVDVVHYAPATSTGLEGGHPHIEVHRHGGTPPRPARYATPERACRVERVTRPLAERFELCPYTIYNHPETHINGHYAE